MHDRMNIHTPEAGLPAPKNPKRNTHANMAMSITPFMPKRFRHTGMSRMQSVSLICEREMSALAF